MSDFKFIAFVVFLFLVFGMFISLFTTSEIESHAMDTNITYNILGLPDADNFNKFTDMTSYKTYSIYGTVFISGLTVLFFVILLRFLRGQ